MNIKNLEQLSYYILPGNPPLDFVNQRLHDKAYLYWRSFWSEVYGSCDGLEGDNFLRQDFIPIVTFQDEIVAMHLYTIFNPDCEATKEHTYFHSYPREFFEYLKKENIKSVMSIESLTVNPNWRKSQIGVSLGETMIGCSLKYLEPLGLDAVIAPTRNDRGVNKMCYNFNFDCYKSNLNYRGFEMDLVCGRSAKVCRSPDENIDSLVNFFWNNRIDLTGRIKNTIVDKNNKGWADGSINEIAI